MRTCPSNFGAPPITAEMLSEMGHEIVQSGSGGRARRLLRAGHYDALVSDYLMPGMTGMGLAAEARLAQQGVRHPLQ